MYRPLSHWFAAILLLGSGVFMVWPDSSGPSTPELIVSRVRSLGVREENTQGEQELLAIVASEAKLRSLQVSSIPIAEAAGEHSFSRLVEVRIPGAGPGTLVLAVPITSATSWGESAVGIGAAFGLMDRLAASTPPVSLRIVFLGADENLLGSRAYAAYSSEEPSIAVLRAEIGACPGESAELLYGGQRALSPYWFLDRGIHAVRGAGLKAEIKANRSFLYRMGLVDAPTPLDPWFQENIPALTLRVSGGGPSGPAELTPEGMERAAALLESFVRSFSPGVPDHWDKQYVLFEAAGIRVAVRETRYIAIVLAIFALLGLLFATDSMWNRNLFREDIRRAPRVAAALVAVFFVLFLSVLACTAISKAALRGIAAPEYWRLHPIAFSGFRFLQLFALFITGTSVLAHFGLIPKRAGFFRGSAVVVLGADVLLFSALRVSVSFLFLWALIVTVMARRLSGWLKRKWPNTAGLLFSLFPLVFVIAELVKSPELIAFGGFLFPSPRGIAYSCFVALPFLLMIVALGEDLFGKEFYHARTAVAGLIAFSVVSCVGVFMLLGDVRNYGEPVEAEVREYIDAPAGTRHFEVVSPRPLPDAALRGAGVVLNLQSGASTWSSETFKADKPLVSLEADKHTFLDRTTIALSVDAAGQPYRLNIEIPKILSGSIYDCSLPFASSGDGDGIVLDVGVRPPMPLRIIFTVSRDFEAQAYLTTEYREGVDTFESSGALRVTRYSTRYRSGILLSSRNSLSR